MALSLSTEPDTGGLLPALGLTNDHPLGWLQPTPELREAECQGLCMVFGRGRADGRRLAVAKTPAGVAAWGEFANECAEAFDRCPVLDPQDHLERLTEALREPDWNDPAVETCFILLHYGLSLLHDRALPPVEPWVSATFRAMCCLREGGDGAAQIRAACLPLRRFLQRVARAAMQHGEIPRGFGSLMTTQMIASDATIIFAWDMDYSATAVPGTVHSAPPEPQCSVGGAN